jgi:hypothetical protein
MEQFLGELKRVCKKGANAGIIIGNAYFPETLIDIDIIVPLIAERLGFTAKKIIVLNKRFALVKRTHKKGILRESLIMLER